MYIKILFYCFIFSVFISLTGSTVTAQSKTNEDIDILHYKIEAEITPSTHTIRATAAVTIKILKPVQQIAFELNGSLEVVSVFGPNKTPLKFSQDRFKDLNVKVAFSQLPEVGKEITLIFEYSGQLITSNGGALPDKRLAYIGKEGIYLFYAARWFPFNLYAVDTATYEISIILPKEFNLVAFGQHTQEKFPPKTVSTSSGGNPQRQILKNPQETDLNSLLVKHTFISKDSILPGTIIATHYTNHNIKRNDIDIELYVNNEKTAENLSEIIGEVISFYSNKFGVYPFGKKIFIAEIDNESLETYTTAGMILISNKLLSKQSESMREILAREVAYQWWGQAVGLKSFDDVWLSQGLATFSYLQFEESRLKAIEFSELCRDFAERALAFEEKSSILKAPAELDDQSAEYKSIIYYKGAFVFRMLQNLMGEENFSRLLKTYYTEFRNSHVSIDEFEKLASKIQGTDLRYFFGHWVDSTSVPEFQANYQILRTKDNKFRIRGTVEQNLEVFKSPVEITVEGKTNSEKIKVQIDGKSTNFVLNLNELPENIVIDPQNKILKISNEIRENITIRRAIQYTQENEFAEAQKQFEAAIKLNRSSSWTHYNLGLLYLKQKNYQHALDAFSETLDGDLHPSWIESWTYLKRGNAYDLLGQRDRAIAEYNKVIESGNNYNDVQELAKKYLNTPYRSEEKL